MGLTQINTLIQEGASATLFAKLRDPRTRELVPKSSVVSLFLTLYDEFTKTIINSRDKQNVLDANGGAIDANGEFTMQLDPIDNIIVDPTKAINQETHVALFQFTFDGGFQTGIQEVFFEVNNTGTIDD